MAQNGSSKLGQQLVDLSKQYSLLLAQQKKFIDSGKTSAEVEKQFASAKSELAAKIKEVNKGVQGFINLNAKAAKSNKELDSQISDLKGKQARLLSREISDSKMVNDLKRSEENATLKLIEKNEKLKEKARKATALAERKQLREDIATLKQYIAQKKAEDKRLEQAEIAAFRQKVKEKQRLLRESLAEEKRIARQAAKEAADAEKARQRSSVSGGFSSVFTGQSIGRAIGSLVKYVAIYRAMAIAIGAVKTVTTDAVKLFVDFGDKLGKVSAVSGATGTQMKSLTAAIRTTAKETRFTATEVADLALTLSKLGATTNQIESLISPISLAAQALGTNLAETGETILKINNQFNLSAAQTAETAQVLVGAINNSALSLESFRVAISYIGPIANQSNETFQETASFMRVLADNGFQASKIGTGLRKVFLELQEGGVPLVDTLAKLAERNITLAEAEKLVGKTGASQLLTLTENIETIKILNSETFTYYNTLTSAAAQMSTTAGQADILKSAFQDVQLSIGELIVNSELFIDLIGLLSTESEKLARAYAVINKAQRENPVELRKTIDELVAGTKTASEAALELTRRTYKEGAKQFDAAVAQIVKKTKLTTDQVTQLLAAAGQTGGIGEEAWNNQIELLNQLGLNLEKDAYGVSSLRDKFREAFNVYDIEEFSGALGGVINQFNEQKRIAAEAKRSEQERLSVTKKYQATLAQVQKLGVGNAEARKLALEAEKKIQTEISQLSLANLQMQAGMVKMDEKALESNQNKINALQNQLNFLKVYTEDVDQEAEERAQKLRDKQKKQLEEAMRLDKKRVDEQIEAAKQLLATEKEVYDLRIKAAQENGDTAEALRLNVEYTEKEVAANEELAVSIKAFEDKWKSAYVTVNGKKLKNIIDTDSVIDAIDSLTDKISDLALTPSDIYGWLKDVDAAVSSALKDGGVEVAKEAADKVLAEMIQRLKDAGASQEIQNLFQELFTLTIYPKIDDQAVEDAEKVAKDLLDRSEADTDAILKQHNKAREDFAKTLRKFLQDSAKMAADIYQQQQDAEFEALMARLDQEKMAIQERSEFEQKLLDAQVNNQLISQQEYASRLAAIKRKEIQQENAINKKVFDSEQKRDREGAKISFLEAIASIIPNLIVKEGRADPATLLLLSVATTALASASLASELTAINKRKFYPKKFAEGGVVNGPSHANGGVPFSVSGMGGYEMEGGEYIINKESTKRYKSLLDKINGSTQGTQYTFARGGVVSGQEAMARQLEYLEAIASATTSTAINVSKPIRSFVSSDDLANNETARRLKERNKNL